ncbi:MAG: hypothetical protein ACPLZC_07255 [Candidatus Bathyarchaeales archaeon]
MSLRGALWASTCALLLLMLLWFLRLFNILGSEYEILTRWISAIGLIILGMFIGILASERKIQIKTMIIPFILFALGFCFAPFVAVGILMLTSNFPFSRGIEPLIVGGSIIGYLSLYMLFWFWLNKKKGIFQIGEAD